MQELIKQFEAEGRNVYSATVINDGVSETVRFKDYEYDPRAVSLRNIYSVAKVFTVTAIGFLYDEGKIRPEDTLKEIFDHLPEGSDPKWENVTVHNLLCHESGYLHGYDLDCDNIRELTEDEDWFAFLLRHPIEGTPGVDHSYSDMNYYALSCIVSQITGKPMQDYLRVKFFNPAKVREWAWSADPLGRALGGTALYISSTDMAKLGQLWLQKGKWEGKQILSEEWVDLALKNQYELKPRDGDPMIVGKGGLFGQNLIVDYHRNRVVAFQSYWEYNRPPIAR